MVRESSSFERHLPSPLPKKAGLLSLWMNKKYTGMPQRMNRRQKNAGSGVFENGAMTR
jgi:hypothetical protein